MYVLYSLSLVLGFAFPLSWNLHEHVSVTTEGVWCMCNLIGRLEGFKSLITLVISPVISVVKLYI